MTPPAQPRPQPSVDLGRGSRTSVYLEPELYEKAMEMCIAQDVSYSTLIRRLLLQHLLKEGKLSTESVMKLLGAA